MYVTIVYTTPKALAQGGRRLRVCVQAGMAKRPRDTDLECPVCLEQLRPPIFQCVNGHLVCQKCLVRIETSTRKCPTCRMAFTDRIRSLQADRRAEELTDTRSQSKHETASRSSADIPAAANIVLPTRSTRNADPLSETAKQGIAKWSVENKASWGTPTPT